MQQSDYLIYSAPPDTTWQMSHCHFQWKVKRQCFFSEVALGSFRHLPRIASFNVFDIWLDFSWSGMINMENWFQGYLCTSHLNTEDRVRYTKGSWKGSWSFTFQIIPFNFKGERQFMILWFQCPLSKMTKNAQVSTANKINVNAELKWMGYNQISWWKWFG